jgi:alanine dehydrogenase
MIVGIPRERKLHEYGVGATPSGFRECVSRGHAVFVETEAGFGDDSYVLAGATVLDTADDL